MDHRQVQPLWGRKPIPAIDSNFKSLLTCCCTQQSNVWVLCDVPRGTGVRRSVMCPGAQESRLGSRRERCSGAGTSSRRGLGSEAGGLCASDRQTGAVLLERPLERSWQNCKLTSCRREQGGTAVQHPANHDAPGSLLPGSGLSTPLCTRGEKALCELMMHTLRA